MDLKRAVKELGNRSLSWPEKGITLTAPSEPAPGARLSEPCGACRIIRLFDDSMPSLVPEGVGTQGHLLESLFIDSLLEPSADPYVVYRQYSINWGAGISGLDAVIFSGDYAAHYELKSSSKVRSSPTKDNLWQVAKQRAVAEMAGVELPPSVIFIVGKSGRDSLRVGDAFPVVPSEADMLRAKDEILLTNLVVSELQETQESAREHPTVRQLRKEGCYACYPLTKVDADGPAMDLISEWATIMPSYKEAKDWKEDFDGRVKEFISDVPPGEYELVGLGSLKVYESGRHKFMASKSLV